MKATSLPPLVARVPVDATDAQLALLSLGRLQPCACKWMTRRLSGSRQCDAVLQSIDSLLRHVGNHILASRAVSKGLTLRCTWLGCHDAGFLGPAAVLEHVKLKHVVEVSWICPFQVCPTPTSEVSFLNLASHVRSRHDSTDSSERTTPASLVIRPSAVVRPPPVPEVYPDVPRFIRLLPSNPLPDIVPATFSQVRAEADAQKVRDLAAAEQAGGQAWVDECAGLRAMGLIDDISSDEEDEPSRQDSGSVRARTITGSSSSKTSSPMKSKVKKRSAVGPTLSGLSTSSSADGMMFASFPSSVTGLPSNPPYPSTRPDSIPPSRLPVHLWSSHPSRSPWVQLPPADDLPLPPPTASIGSTRKVPPDLASESESPSIQPLPKRPRRAHGFPNDPDPPPLPLGPGDPGYKPLQATWDDRYGDMMEQHEAETRALEAEVAEAAREQQAADPGS